MANTERPLSFLKDDFKNPSSGVNPAASKNQSFMFPQSLLWTKKVPASDCSKRQQQLRAHHRAAVAVGIYKNRCYILFLSGGWGCRTTHGKSAPSLGNIGFSWVPRIWRSCLCMPYQASSHSLRSPVAGSHGMPSLFT